MTSINGGSSDNNNLLITGGNSSTPLFLPFSNPPASDAAIHQNPNPLFFLPRQEATPPLLQQIQHSTYLDLPVPTVSTPASVTGENVADTISFGLTPDGSVAALHAAAGGHRRQLTRDFLGVYDGEVEELPQLPLYATVPHVASCATDLTRKYIVSEQLPPVNGTWSHNF
jgi:hypothetical protein